MARKPGAPKLSHNGQWWRLRFTHDGTRHDFKTGVIPADDHARAIRWMNDRVKWVHSGQWKNDEQIGIDTTAKLSDVAAAYLDEKGGGDITARTAELYKLHLKKHFMPRFKRLSDITRGSLASYQSERLKHVRYATIKKELTTLRQVLRFAEIRGWIGTLPRFPNKPGKSQGTKARQAPSGWTKDFTVDHARQLVQHLPELAKRDRATKEQWPLRGYFAIMVETGLRPGLWDGFRVGIHWRPGQEHLQVTEEVDKEKWARRLPLSPYAKEILEGVYYAEIHRLGKLRNGGQLFRALDFRVSLRKAARSAGIPEHIAARVKAYDMRHARTTELMDRSHGRTLGVGFLVGHKQATTTNRYSHADEKQAAEVVGIVSGANSGGEPRKRDFGLCVPTTKTIKLKGCEGGGSNSHGYYPTSTSRARFRQRLLGYSGFPHRQRPLEVANSGYSGIRTQYSGDLLALVKAAHKRGVLPGQKRGWNACWREVGP